MEQKRGKTFVDLYNEEKEKPTAAQEFVAKIAKSTGKAEFTVRQWLRGAQNPDKANRDAVAKVLGADVKELFPELEEPERTINPHTITLQKTKKS